MIIIIVKRKNELRYNLLVEIFFFLCNLWKIPRKTFQKNLKKSKILINFIYFYDPNQPILMLKLKLNPTKRSNSSSTNVIDRSTENSINVTNKLTKRSTVIQTSYKNVNNVLTFLMRHRLRMWSIDWSLEKKRSAH